MKIFLNQPYFNHPSLIDITKKLGEPKYIFKKEKHLSVHNENFNLLNNGIVAVWDTVNSAGEGFIQGISFENGTSKWRTFSKNPQISNRRFYFFPLDNY